MPRYQSLVAAIAVVFLVTPLAAQGTTRTSLTSNAGSVPAPSTAFAATDSTPATFMIGREPVLSMAPTITHSVSGVQFRTDGTRHVPLPFDDGRTGRNAAMMIVGGAGLIVGSIIGGDTGTIVMIGGGALGLYGMWQYLK